MFLLGDFQSKSPVFRAEDMNRECDSFVPQKYPDLLSPDSANCVSDEFSLLHSPHHVVKVSRDGQQVVALQLDTLDLALLTENVLPDLVMGRCSFKFCLGEGKNIKHF